MPLSQHLSAFACCRLFSTKLANMSQLHSSTMPEHHHQEAPLNQTPLTTNNNNNMGASQSLQQPRSPPPTYQQPPMAYPPQSPIYNSTAAAANNLAPDGKPFQADHTYVQAPSPSPKPGSPYIQSAPLQGPPAKTPMENMTQTFNKWGKKAEDITGNVLTHLRTGPNVADTAWGRITMGTKMLTEGGMINIFRQTFPSSSPDESLLKTYACYLSTTTGPLPGTLFISTHKLAFCSDRPLSTNSPTSTTSASTNPPTSTTSAEQSWTYYKVVLPLEKVRAVEPSENKNKPTEKYIQVATVDQHEFWFMGFVNYEKGLKNLQDAVKNRAYKH